MSDPNMDDLRLAYQLETQEVDDDGNVVIGFDQAGEMFNRAIAAHDAEVILDYVRRAKPGPIHIDNIDGVKAGDWFRARDAATREAVLVEVAEWHEEKERIHWIKARETPGGTNSRQRLDLIATTHRLAAERFRALTAHTPQIVPETGQGATQSAPAGDWSSDDLTPALAAHDGFVKVAAKMSMTTTEMAARNTKARKEAHDLDVDHAVALERAAIVSHLQRRQSKHYAEFDKWGDPSEQERGIAYDMAWQEVQNGTHNRRAGG